MQQGPDNGDPSIDGQRVYKMSELFKFSVHYRGKNPEHFARTIHRVNVLGTVVIKFKTVLFSLCIVY